MYIINQHNFEGIPRNGLIGEWLFSGNANDTSGNGNNGTVSGATLTSDRKGSPNSAYSFNGSAHIVINPFTLLAGLQTFTICFWAKGVTYTTGQIGVSVYYAPGGVNELLAIYPYHSGGGNGARVFYNNATILDINGTTIGVTNWNFFVFTSTNNNDQSIDVNDGVDYQQALSLNKTMSANTDILGIGYYNGTQNFVGDLDDIRIYNRILTASEITTIYNE